jgi:hypothetical protein
LALGNLKQRTTVLSDLHALPRVVLASDEEVLNFVARRTLFGRGIALDGRPSFSYSSAYNGAKALDA